MIGALTTLLLFQLAGETIVRFWQLPVPGPVLGMALLFLALLVRDGPSHELRETSTRLLQHLSLLFVPAGVGVMLHFQRIADEWSSIGIALIASTIITIAATALLLQALMHTAGRAK